MKVKDVMMHLLLKQPFYGSIASAITIVESNSVKTTKTSLIPSPTFIYNKEWYEGLKNEFAIGVLLQGLLQLILLHSFRRGNRENNIWVIACDMAVSEYINRRMLPEAFITVDKISEEIKEKIPKLKSAEFYYDILSKSDHKLSFTEEDKEIKIVLRSGQELKANSSTEGNSEEINKNAVKSMLSELIQEAQTDGEIPSDISSFVREIYSNHEINWRNVLKRFLSGRGKVKVKKSYKKESKRYENLPGNKRTFGTNALVALDESGSISEKQLESFYKELVAIKKITGASIIVTEFDIECTKPVPIDKYVRAKKRVKNGGTDFKPVFDLADELHIPQIIIFTDGEGPAPKEVNQRVLWVLTKDGKKPVEYGFSFTFNK